MGGEEKNNVIHKLLELLIKCIFNPSPIAPVSIPMGFSWHWCICTWHMKDMNKSHALEQSYCLVSLLSGAHGCGCVWYAVQLDMISHCSIRGRDTASLTQWYIIFVEFWLLQKFSVRAGEMPSWLRGLATQTQEPEFGSQQTRKKPRVVICAYNL